MKTWVSRQFGRLHRFFHCFWYTFADRGTSPRMHREVTIIYCNHQVPTRIDWLLPHEVDSLSCECGKVFWKREGQ